MADDPQRVLKVKTLAREGFNANAYASLADDPQRVLKGISRARSSARALASLADDPQRVLKDLALDDAVGAQIGFIG